MKEGIRLCNVCKQDCFSVVSWWVGSSYFHYLCQCLINLMKLPSIMIPKCPVYYDMIAEGFPDAHNSVLRVLTKCTANYVEIVCTHSSILTRLLKNVFM